VDLEGAGRQEVRIEELPENARRLIGHTTELEDTDKCIREGQEDRRQGL